MVLFHRTPAAPMTPHTITIERADGLLTHEVSMAIGVEEMSDITSWVLDTPAARQMLRDPESFTKFACKYDRSFRTITPTCTTTGKAAIIALVAALAVSAVRELAPDQRDRAPRELLNELIQQPADIPFIARKSRAQFRPVGVTVKCDEQDVANVLARGREAGLEAHGIS